MENHNQPKSIPAQENKVVENPAKGLNDWNDRLDENLEAKDQNDTVADDNAKDYSEKFDHNTKSDK